MSGAVKLCDICYLLVVAEHELSQIEKKVAEALNIPVPSDDGTPAKVDRNDPFVKAQQTKEVKSFELGSTLVQWRLLFVFKSLKDVNF